MNNSFVYLAAMEWYRLYCLVRRLVQRAALRIKMLWRASQRRNHPLRPRLSSADRRNDVARVSQPPTLDRKGQSCLARSARRRRQRARSPPPITPNWYQDRLLRPGAPLRPPRHAIRVCLGAFKSRYFTNDEALQPLLSMFCSE